MSELTRAVVDWKMRQVGPTLAEIREDHKARYRYASAVLPRDIRVIDAGCGIGYGSWIMAQFRDVFAIEIDEAALKYAGYHYPHPRIRYRQRDLEQLLCFEQATPFDAAVCFEMLEHVHHPERVLENLRNSGAKTLLCSVPNETAMPFNAKDFPEHVRHYTEPEFVSLVEGNGWAVAEILGQHDKLSDVEIHPSLDGVRTLVIRAARKP